MITGNKRSTSGNYKYNTVTSGHPADARNSSYTEQNRLYSTTNLKPPMKNTTLASLNMTYFHQYHMSYDLIASYIRQEMKVSDLQLHHFPDPESLLNAVKENKMDIVMINSSCLFDGYFRETEIRKVLSVLCANKHTTTVLFAQNMKPVLLKKMAETGMDIMISSHDTPHELVTALMNAMMTANPEPYISQTIKAYLQQTQDELTTKEWEVINLINQGYSLSQIASKKCRAMSTVSTQKRNAMNKLHITSESELLRFLHQNTFF